MLKMNRQKRLNNNGRSDLFVEIIAGNDVSYRST